MIVWTNGWLWIIAALVLALIELMLDDNGSITPDFDDEVIAAACVTRIEEEVKA